MSKIKAPWLSHYAQVPHTLKYPEGSMCDAIFDTCEKYPQMSAYSFMGKSESYESLRADIIACAKSFCAIGIKPGDKVTICMPNMPQTVIAFYALNRMGAVCNMVHPLSSENEILFYLKDSKSVAALTMDQFYDKFEAIRGQYKLKKLLITSAKDALSGVKKFGYSITQGLKMPKIPKNDPCIIEWKAFLSLAEGYSGDGAHNAQAGDPAAVLYSGGTTGKTKGILLSNRNFNALAMQTIAMAQCVKAGNSMLSVMPMFHGFGLGVCIHLALLAGCRCILVPRVSANIYAELLKKEQPSYIAGVPTLYEAILRNPDMDGVDLSCLKGVFSGGDSLSVELKRRFDAFLKEHNADVVIREGYGTTETVTACCLTPYNKGKEGSIGLPFPDTFFKIVGQNTIEELPYGEEGEICISGPTMMMEYVGQPIETAQTLRTHSDGRTWVHTGDLGVMDEEGFVFFKQRLKRMIISSGYSIYPSQLENLIDAHECVQMSCVIGVPDPYKVQKVKAFVVLRPGIEETPELLEALFEHCRKNIAKYAMPYDIEIREDLPKTLVGKVAYRVLEEEEEANLVKANG